MRRLHAGELPRGMAGGPLSALLAAAGPSHGRRGRFYRPLANQGVNLWRRRMGRLHAGWDYAAYARARPDARPAPEPAVNDYHGRTRLWNPIAGKIGVVNEKAANWNWPEGAPPPTGLRRSREFIPHFLERYFPDVEVRLVLDSVLDHETTRPAFHIPPDMSRRELANYLKNLYGIDPIVRVHVQNKRGRRFKNEVGQIKSLPDYKLAIVELDSPVKIEIKQIKGSEDTPDNSPQAQVT